MTNKCSLCNEDAKYYHSDFDGSIYDCPRCGRVEISGTMEAVLLGNEEFFEIKHILSGVTRYLTVYKLKPIRILSYNFKYLLDQFFVPRNITDKLNLFLKYLSYKSNHPGDFINIDRNLDYSITFSKNVIEFNFIIEQLKKKNLIEQDGGANKFRLTVEGWNRIDEINQIKEIKKQAFVAMWFTDDLYNIYENGFRKAIKDTDFEPMRIDLKQHNNKIDDEIIAEIKNSAFLIADFTGQRGGVYFEAGFAKGLGIPVIWTCRNDEIKDLHFDTRQFNHIEWNDEIDLYKKLVNRIKATIK